MRSDWETWRWWTVRGMVEGVGRGLGEGREDVVVR